MQLNSMFENTGLLKSLISSLQSVVVCCTWWVALGLWIWQNETSFFVNMFLTFCPRSVSFKMLLHINSLSTLLFNCKLYFVVLTQTCYNNTIRYWMSQINMKIIIYLVLKTFKFTRKLWKQIGIGPTLILIFEVIIGYFGSTKLILHVSVVNFTISIPIVYLAI